MSPASCKMALVSAWPFLGRYSAIVYPESHFKSSPKMAAATAGPVRGRTGRENPYPFATLTHRGFRGWFTQPDRSEQLKIQEHAVQRDFSGLRGHAPRNALCGGILLPCGGSHPTPVSPAGSGAGRRWRPFSADRSGNVDRFAAERRRRSLTLSRAHTLVEAVLSQAREGDVNL